MRECDNSKIRISVYTYMLGLCKFPEDDLQ